MDPMKQADSKIVNNKTRSVLRVLSPIPTVPGKSTVELDGEPIPRFALEQAEPDLLDGVVAAP